MSESLEAWVRTRAALRVMPLVAQRVFSALQNPDRLSAQDLASLIAHDPVLCARVIRESNSAYHGKLEVKELVGAVVVLGFNRATEVALAASCMEAFGNASDLRTRFAWRRGLLVATAAGRLARSVFGGGGDVLFVAGLLHDLGRSALRSFAPEVERAAYAEAADDMEA